MICPNCGETINDDALFCKACGSKISNSNAYETATTFESSSVQTGDNGSSDDERNKKLGMIVLGGAALIIILLIVLCVNAFSSSIKDPIDDVVSLVNKKSTSVDKWIKNLLPNDIGSNASTIWNAIADTDEIDEDDIEDYFDEMYEELEDTYGKNYKVSYKILDKEKLDSDERKDLQDAWRDLADYLDYDDDDWDDAEDELADEIGSSKAKKVIKAMKAIYEDLDKFKITEAYEVDLKISIEGKEDDDSTKATIYVIKYDGKYCIDWVNSSLGSYSLTSLLWNLSYYY